MNCIKLVMRTDKNVKILDVENEAHKANIETAINKAVDECIAEGILKEFFKG